MNYVYILLIIGFLLRRLLREKIEQCNIPGSHKWCTKWDFYYLHTNNYISNCGDKADLFRYLIVWRNMIPNSYLFKFPKPLNCRVPWLISWKHEKLSRASLILFAHENPNSIVSMATGEVSEKLMKCPRTQPVNISARNVMSIGTYILN